MMKVQHLTSIKDLSGPNGAINGRPCSSTGDRYTHGRPFSAGSAVCNT